MNFLLEIGTEEIPHWMIPGALDQLSKLDLLGAAPLVDATPRRLVVKAGGVPVRTADQEQVVKGPPLSAGDKAAAGFAKKQGVELSAMTKVGDYYELRKTVPGRRAIDILADYLPGAIIGLQWPKTMYWTAKNGPRFIRPIRWIVALLDDQVIPFEIAGVRSGAITRGHRQLGAAAIPVTIENYNQELRKNFVILSSHERHHKIETEASTLGAKIDADLLETLTFITEYPTAIRGEFDPKFLELPAEVLTTVMRHHQKYFSVESAPGVLAPSFVAVMNTSGDPEGLVKHGNERVLKARFNDAQFFWKTDLSRKFEDRLNDLERVTFHVRLGTYREKTESVRKLAVELAEKVPQSYTEAIEEAALLCKCDLTSELVKEFPELQGVVGGLYALAQGKKRETAMAIYDHYKPTSAEDSIPRTQEGNIVALADKVDTLRRSFEIGMVPTGSKDPFALRRAAQGVVRILAEGNLDVHLSHLSAGNVDLLAFLKDRVANYFKESKKFPYDEVAAAMAANYEDVPDLEARLKAVHDVRPTEHFEPLASAFKRMRNILRQAGFDEVRIVDETLLEDGPERNLYETYKRISTELWEVHLASKDYRAGLLMIASIRPQVDTFFDKVLVNAPDSSVRANRLTLLNHMLTELSMIADFSEIVTAGEQK
jgi:glycyl-tRNA synthetase beta chain